MFVTIPTGKRWLAFLPWLVACPAAYPQEAATAGQPDARAYVYECMGEESFVVDVHGEIAWLFLPGKTVSLAKAPSASGIKYSDGEIVFWSRGEEAMIEARGKSYRQCRNNRARAIWENSKLRGNDFRAVGNEPGWVLEIASSSFGDTGDIVFIAAYGEERYEFLSTTMLADKDGARTTFISDSDSGHFMVILEGRQCLDSMSGESFQTTVTVNLFGREYTGCGNPLH